MRWAAAVLPIFLLAGCGRADSRQRLANDMAQVQQRFNESGCSIVVNQAVDKTKAEVAILQRLIPPYRIKHPASRVAVYIAAKKIRVVILECP